MFDDRFSSSVLNERICLQIIKFSIRYVDEPSESVSENIENNPPCVLQMSKFVDVFFLLSLFVSAIIKKHSKLSFYLVKSTKISKF